VTRGPLAATQVLGPEETEHEPARTWQEIRRILEQSTLSAAVRERALGIFGRLAQAEAMVHGVAVSEVHFHEVGGLDAIADIVGIAAAICHLAPAGISASALTLGSGTVMTRHGPLPVPAPATVALLKGVPCVPGPEGAGELVTPTGAAVITALAERFGAAPAMRPWGQGFGAGSREVAGRTNVLRVVAGEPLAEEADGAGAADDWIEAAANIDDMNPEWGPHVLARLIEAGASDAWQAALSMKKGRQGVQLGFLCRRHELERLAGVLLSESTTIGVRYHPVQRVESVRRIIEVETPYGPVHVKLATAPDGSVNVAPEHEDCRCRALEAGVPLKRVYQAAIAAVPGDLSDKPES
jgi:uncharacterized protein (TIGR00299 family) protein